MVENNLIQRADLEYVMDCVTNAKCCAIVGLSNMGKSRLLRTLASQTSTGLSLDTNLQQFLFIYIDFNLMLDVSEQGFYELILRSILSELERLDIPADLIQNVEEAYQGIINPASTFAISLNFVEGILAANAALKYCLILLFDEFDEPFRALDDRVFLNLRALKDRYSQSLCYVTATGQMLRDMRQEHGISEFAELFAHHIHFLHPLEREEAIDFIRSLMAETDITLNRAEIDFIWEQAGGHLGLMEATLRALAEVHQAELNRLEGTALTRRMQEILDNDLNVRTESAKLWNNLTKTEHEALLEFLAGDPAEAEKQTWMSLYQKGVLIKSQSGKYRVFGRLFQDFAHRQKMIQQKSARGLRLDVDSGTVWVNGKVIPELTGLEYRLLLLLYGNLDKTCDKYKIVESVWSEDYLDEVDDARVEKLVSRLRQKIEPVPNEPRYLLTVRGRGYKLVNPAT